MMRRYILIGALAALSVGCSQETDVDRCVDAGMKVYDADNPNATTHDRDSMKATWYIHCRRG